MKPITLREDTIIQEVTIEGSAEPIFERLTNPMELVRWCGVEGKFQGDAHGIRFASRREVENRSPRL
jgi:uncharacterized protein YndB with AHSA1/START domain